MLPITEQLPRKLRMRRRYSSSREGVTPIPLAIVARVYAACVCEHLAMKTSLHYTSMPDLKSGAPLATKVKWQKAVPTTHEIRADGT